MNMDTSTNSMISLRKILSEAWGIFIKNFLLIALITIIVYVPVNLIFYAISFDGLSSVETLKMYSRIQQILEGMIGILATIAITYVVQYKKTNQEISIIQSFRLAFSRWGRVIWSSGMTGALLMLLYLLFVIPGIIYSVYWIFFLSIIVLRDVSRKEAREYSKSLVKGRWWKTASYAFVIGIITIGLSTPLLIGQYFLPDIYWINIIVGTAFDIVYNFSIIAGVCMFFAYEAYGNPQEIITVSELINPQQ